MNLDAYLDFLKRMFLSNTETFALTPDFTRDLVFTGATFLIGWILSLRASRSRLKSRLIDELIMAQREMSRRAYPDDFGEVWSLADRRTEYMLQPFVDRLRFLSANIADEKGITSRGKTAVELYMQSVSNFIVHWAKGGPRTERYEYLFLQTHRMFRNAMKELGNQDHAKLRGTVPPRFAMQLNLGHEQRKRKRAVPQAAE